MARFDRKEKELLTSVDRGEWKSVAGLKRERNRYRQYATAAFKKEGVTRRLVEKKV